MNTSQTLKKPLLGQKSSSDLHEKESSVNKLNLSLSTSMSIDDDGKAPNSERSNRDPIVSRAAQAATLVAKQKLNSSMSAADMKKALSSTKKQ